MSGSADAGALVTYTVSSTDNCDPNPGVTSVPPSGSLFPIGTTVVHSTATDASGNQASCAFSVTVVGARGVKQDVLAELIALRASILCTVGIGGGNPSGNAKGTEETNEKVCQKLDEAIRHLRVALDPELWVDEKHVQSRHGEPVFDEEHATAGLLCQLVHLPSSGLPDALLQGFIARLNRADRLLASAAIQDASAAGVPTQRIVQAQKFLAEGDADAAVDSCGDAITDYRQAWRHAVRPQVSLPIGLPNGHTQLELLAEPGARVTVQASTNLVDWVTLGTATANGDGVLQFEGTEAASHALRYYRALSP
jgi:HYR domain